MAIDIAARVGTGGARRRRRAVRLSGWDRVTVTIMAGVPLLVVGGIIWFPTIASILLSFTNWDGIGGITNAHWIGTENYRQIATIYPPFWPAVKHNLIWLGFLTFVATPFGLLLAYQLDKKIRGTRIYQSIFFLPVVLSFAIIGFIWELIYSPSQGLINNLIGDPSHGHVIDWLGNPKLNLWAILVAVGWRHAGYIMVLYLAGLKAIDPSLREAAAIDGFLMSRHPKNATGAKQLLRFLGSAAAANAYLKTDSNDVGTNKKTSTAHYSVLQKKAAKMIAGAKHIAQYMDRDTRPDFASTVMIPALQQFLNNPSDVDGLVKSIQKQKKAIFGS